MRLAVVAFVIVVLCVAAQVATAGVAVSAYGTSAQTNGYAPFSKAVYFALDDKPNVSPAVADVSVDWTGTNSGGSTTTWRWIGTAHTSTATEITSNALSITGAGSFAFDLSTTEDFIDARQAGGVFSPGSDSGYSCYFTVDVPSSYSLTAQLNHLSYVTLASQTTGSILVQRINVSAVPDMVNIGGTLAPGQYQFGAGANFGPPNLPNGFNHSTDAGNFSNLTFSVQAPEPTSCPMVVLFAMGTSHSRSRPHGRKHVRSAPCVESRLQ